jgi:hypothetical protein
MGGADDPEKWVKLLAAFMDRSASVGVTGRRFVLCFLAILAAILMVLRISPIWAIAFVVVLYCLEPMVQIARTLADKRRANADLTTRRTNFRRFVTRRRKRIHTSEPELPLPLPAPQDGDGEDK